jgi:hypothetical protein
MTWMLVWTVCACGIAVEPAQAPLTRETFDRLDQAINQGDGFKTGSGDQIAWGESYIMLAYVDMYRATKDTSYLDKLVDHADSVLRQRDDVRGFKDYSGRSRPAWSVGGKYTVAELVLKDAGGRDAIRFRSTPYAFNDETRIHVTPTDDRRRFDLAIENPKWPPREEYRNLSMDRNSPDFVERRINARDWVAIERQVAYGEQGSHLVTVEVIREANGIPVNDAQGKPLAGRDVAMVPLVMAYHGYSGQATYPMLEFAWVVRQEPGLRAKYGKAADRYIAEAARVFRDAEEEWRDGPQDGEGYYVFGARGCPFWADNVGKPFNYLCGEARSLVRLAQLTGDAHWERRAKAIARLFKRHLRPADNGAYVWYYWWGPVERGWTRENSPSLNTPTFKGQATIEDSSHGHLEIEFACLCAQAGWVFDETDMHRLAATFLKNVVDPGKWTMNDRVDGKSTSGQHDTVVGGWIELAAWEPQVARAGLRVGQTQNLTQNLSGVALLSMARIIKWAPLAAETRPQ